MLANALFATTVVFIALGFYLLDQCRFLIPYRDLLIHRHGRTIGLFALVLFGNLLAGFFAAPQPPEHLRRAVAQDRRRRMSRGRDESRDVEARDAQSARLPGDAASRPHDSAAGRDRPEYVYLGRTGFLVR